MSVNKNEIAEKLNEKKSNEVTTSLQDIRSSMERILGSDISSGDSRLEKINKTIEKLNAMLSGLTDLYEVNEGVGIHVQELIAKKDTLSLEETKEYASTIHGSLGEVNSQLQSINMAYDKMFNQDKLLNEFNIALNNSMNVSDNASIDSANVFNTLNAVVQKLGQYKDKISKDIDTVKTTDKKEVVENVNIDEIKADYERMKNEYITKKNSAEGVIANNDKENDEEINNVESIIKEISELDESSDPNIQRKKEDLMLNAQENLSEMNNNKDAIESYKKGVSDSTAFTDLCNEADALITRLESEKKSSLDRLDSNITDLEKNNMYRLEALYKEVGEREGEMKELNLSSDIKDVNEVLDRLDAVIKGGNIAENDLTKLEEAKKYADTAEVKTNVNKSIKAYEDKKLDLGKMLEEAENIEMINGEGSEYRKRMYNEMTEQKKWIGQSPVRMNDDNEMFSINKLQMESLLEFAQEKSDEVKKMISECEKRIKERNDIFGDDISIEQAIKETQENIKNMNNTVGETMKNLKKSQLEALREVNQVEINDILLDKKVFPAGVSVVSADDVTDVIDKVRDYEGDKGEQSAKVNYDAQEYSTLGLSKYVPEQRDLIVLLEIIKTPGVSSEFDKLKDLFNPNIAEIPLLGKVSKAFNSAQRPDLVEAMNVAIEEKKKLIN